jgi:superfamily II DNA or RNA helicase
LILRDYQLAAVDSVMEQLAQRGSSTLGVAATGLGKTVIFAHVAHRTADRGRVMVIAHREELVRQAADKIEAITGDKVEIEMAAEVADTHMYHCAPCVVASKDTLINRLRKYDPADFALLVTDEAHHAVAATYGRIYDHFKDVPHLGVTATPDRLDEAALARVYGSVAFDYDMRFGIDHGWLVDVHQTCVHVRDLDFSGVGTIAGDLNGKQLAEVLEHEKVLHEMAGPIIELAKWRQTLVFTKSVAQAEMLAEIINRHRPGKARWICGATDKTERSETLLAFRTRAFQFLVNVDVFTEGFDEPLIELVCMCRPTKSRAKYAQMVGRGTRPLPGLVEDIAVESERVEKIRASRKPYLEVLDFVGNSGQHKLMTACDILGGNYEDEVVELAQRKAASAPGRNVTEALDDAEREIRARKKRDADEAARRRHVKGKVDYQTYAVDPFNVFDLPVQRERKWDVGKHPTEKQVAFCGKAGISTEGMSRAQVGQLITEIIRRRKAGLATYKQVRKLRQHGYKTENMTFSEANRHIGELKANGWKKPEEVGA